MDRLLAARHHDERGEQRSDGRAEIAPDLKQRLRQPMPAARRHPRHARGFGVKHRRAEANERRPDQQQKIVPRIGQNDEADQG